MTYRIEVSPRPGYLTEAAEGLVSEIHSLGIPAAESVEISRLFFVKGNVSAEDIERLTAEVLSDEVIETYTIRTERHGSATPGAIKCPASRVSRILLPRR